MRCFSTILVLVFPLCSSGAPVPVKKEEAKKKTPHELLQIVRSEWAEMPADPQTKLESMLEYLSDLISKDKQGELKFEINYLAFAEEGVPAPNQIAIVQETGLPRMTNISLERYLRRVLERVAVPSGATYVIRKDHIEITTNAMKRTQIWGKNFKGPFLPLVHGRFDKKPFEAVMKELADQSDHNILLDPRAAEKAKSAVTANLLNVPLDTAVKLLADMVELQSVLRDNTIYVTTPKQAQRLNPPGTKKPDSKSSIRVGPGVGGSVPIDPSTAAPPPAAAG